MSNDIRNLEPRALWNNFYSLTRIPRPSKNEDQIRNFLAEFGKKLQLETLVDRAGNVIIRKPATPGMENRKGVILQGHMDMVPQKNSDKQHDFNTDPIETLVDGEWVKANGTTLGADNGIGVAAAMAILESKDIPHGPIEVLITTDEETGMTGAQNLEPGILQGDILLNLDSEDEGELYVGCAGGIDGTFTFSPQMEPVVGEVAAFALAVTGLKGGHSGLDINLGRANANKVLFRLLRHAHKEHGLRLARVEGGSLRNAIPREAFATVIVPASEKEKFLKCFNHIVETIRKEYELAEPNFSFTCNPAAIPAQVIDKETQSRLINAVYACPNGVIRMSDAFLGVVETSTNLANVKMENGHIKVLCLLRSSVDSAKQDLADMMASVFELAGATIDFSGSYPGWRPNPTSPILQTMKEVYNQKFGRVPEVKVIHAGLECGILGAVYPHWDMISFGPTIRNPHSPDEKVHIGSVQLFWDYLLETLKHVPVKE
ncbi:MAG: aminoacyl-histidine dipeptidase [Bacteroidales bacterium]